MDNSGMPELESEDSNDSLPTDDSDDEGESNNENERLAQMMMHMLEQSGTLFFLTFLCKI